MRKIVLLLHLLSALLLSQSRDDRWREDLQYLATNLPKTHPNLFFQVKQQDFNQAIAQLDSAIPSKADHEIIVEMARILAMAGDGHTNLTLTQNRAAFHTYPLKLYWFDDGLYVTQAAVQLASTLGTKVVQIGNTPIEQAYATIAGVISHDTEIWVKAVSPNYLVTAEVLQALGIVPDEDKAAFTFERSDGTRFTLTIGSPARGDTIDWLYLPHKAQPAPPVSRRNTNLYYWFDYLPNSRTLYFQYNRCQEAATLPFSSFLEQLLEFAAANDVARFVLDLRNNGGGSTAIIQPLVQVFRRQYAQHTFDPASQVFVMIGRQTFSSAVLNAIDFRSLGATLVGEPGGWKPNGYGEVQSLTLPNSLLQVSCSTRKFSDSLGDALLPDVQAGVSFADYIADRDPALEAATFVRASTRPAAKTMAPAILMDAASPKLDFNAPATTAIPPPARHPAKL